MTSQKVIYAKFLQELREDSNYENFMSNLDPSRSTLPDIFKSVWQHDLANKFINFPAGNPNISKKGHNESEHFRNIGNRLYKEKKHDKALIAYNYAILSAPHPQEHFEDTKFELIDDSADAVTKYTEYECLCFAYANRSVLMVDMEQYQIAIEDIFHSIKYGYPQAKRYKLMERKCKCLVALQKYKEAISLLDQLSGMTNELNLGKKENDAFKNNLQKLRSSCNDGINLDGKDKTDNSATEGKYSKLFYRGPLISPKVHNPRKNYPSVSESVKVRYSSIKGRYLVATKDIDPGEVILLEESYCNTLNIGDDLRHYCNYCLKSAPTPLPCSTCSLVVFCSTSCRNASLGEGGCHASECAILPSLVAMDTDIDGMLVLRTLLPLSVRDLDDKCKKYNKSNSEIISSTISVQSFNETAEDLSEEIFTSPIGDNFDCMYHLEGNVYNRPLEDYLEASVSAVLLVKIILNKIYGHYDPNNSEQNNSKNLKDQLDKSLLGGLVLRLLLNFQCNAHCVKELQLKQDELAILSKLAIIGYGVYCNLSLVNHSCNPNVLHSTSGKVKFLYAISCINKGDEICDSYGERYVSHRLSDRQESIEKTYHFKCDCIACTKDWPIFKDLPSKFSLKCFKCKTSIDRETSKCRTCEIVYMIQKKSNTNKKSKKPKALPPYDAAEIRQKISSAWDNYNIVTNNINKGVIPESSDFSKLKEITKLLDKYSIHPNKPLVQVQEFMMRYYDLQAAVAKL